MADERPNPRWKARLGYLAFAIFTFVTSLYLTFPYDAIRQRLQTEAAAAGLQIKLGSVGPGLLGVTARKLELARVQKPEEEAPPTPLLIDRVSLRPSLFPAGVAITADAFGGGITGAFGGLGNVAINLNLEELDPALGNLKAATGLDLEGKLTGHLRLSIPKVPTGAGGKVKEPALNQADGELVLEARGLTLKGGSMELPIMGTMTPMDLPRIALGQIDGRLIIEKGVARVDTFKSTSEDVELGIEGTLKLQNNLSFSEADLLFKIKAAPEFVKRLGLIGSGLSILPADRNDPSVRVAKMTGFLARPNFGPARL